MRRFVLFCAALVLFLPVLAGVAAADPTPTPAQPVPAPPVPGGSGGPSRPTSTAADPEGDALDRAETTGAPVEVLERRSPTEQVFAQPDGSLTATVSARPVRVQSADGTWAAVDPTLRSTGGGLTPAATAVDLTFGAGGSTTLATAALRGKSMTMTWPAVLPAPEVSGAVATYRNVYPDVDLRVEADAEGFEEQLVVRTAAAAANPALRSIRFGLSTTGGLTVRVEADGSIAAVDTAGGTVFRSPAPQMWDTPADPEAVAAGLPGAHQAAVGLAYSAGILTLTPDPAVLAAADLTFPLVIDPSWSTKGPAWTEVNQLSPNSAGWRTVPRSLAVGYQNYQPPTRVRSLIRFPISSAIYGTSIRTATLRLYENWSSSCTKTEMQVYANAGFNPATATWNTQPALGALQGSLTDAHGHDAGCPAANIEFSVKGAVAAAAKARTSVSLTLRAANENDPLGWKKFQIDGTTPQLTIAYNHPPTTPKAADLTTLEPRTQCSASQVANARNGIRLQVRASDPDRDKVKVFFEFTHIGGSTVTYQYGPISSGQVASWVPAATLGSGQYRWRAQVRDVAPGTVATMSSSGWSPTCSFTNDLTKPNTPVVTSAVYPEDQYAGVPGRLGTFGIARGATADTDITQYLYGLDRNPPTTAVTPAADKTASIQVRPPTWGPHDLYVQAKDAAGNLSTAYRYHFYVQAPSDPKGYWRLDERAGGTSAGVQEDTDRPTTPPTATLAGAATWTTGRLDGGLHTDGATGSAGTDLHVPTNGDLTVSAWVRLSSKGRPMTVVSEDSTGISGFLLQYRPEKDRYAFTMPQQDGTSTPIDVAWSTSAVPLNTWTHLTGVYWAADKRIGVFVNGALEGTGTHATSWESTGTVQLGRGRSGGVPADFWPGDLDEVRVYDRSLADGEVADVVNRTKPGPAAVWRMDDGASSRTAADTSDAAGAKVRHPLSLATGTGFIAGGHDNGCLNLNGSGHATGAPVVATDTSFAVSAWVRLTNKSATYAALSQVGTRTARFVLAYRSDIDRWVFNANSTDTDTFTSTGAIGTSVPVAGQWTFLAGVWDAPSGQLKIYVNGKLEGTTATTVSWNATHSFLVGSSKAKGVASARWLGQLDEVRVYDRVLYGGEAADLYRDGRSLASLAAPDGQWNLDEASGTVAADATGRNRPMTLAGSAAFAPAGGRTGGGLRTTVTRDALGAVTAGGTAATTYAALATDRSFVVSAWVRLDDGDRQQAVLSQDGARTSGYSLSYVPDNGGTWRFSLPPADAAGISPTAPAEVVAVDTVGAWVHVVGEYDSFSKETRVWVTDAFGTRVGFGRQWSTWAATGQFRIGQDRTATTTGADGQPVEAYGNYLAGAVDDVAFYSGTLSLDDRTALLAR